MAVADGICDVARGFSPLPDLGFRAGPERRLSQQQRDCIALPIYSVEPSGHDVCRRNYRHSVMAGMLGASTCVTLRSKQSHLVALQLRAALACGEPQQRGGPNLLSSAHAVPRICVFSFKPFPEQACLVRRSYDYIFCQLSAKMGFSKPTRDYAGHWTRCAA